MRKCLVLALLLALLAGCGKKVPVNQSNIVERDRELYEEAMKFLQKSRFTSARALLQNLLQVYPDSEFAPQALYANAESFYMEAGHSNLVSSEGEFNRFITFFPAHDLADDAKLKVAMTHIRQIQKPDRDDTEARLAEFELTSMITTYPDSDLLDEAKVKLRAVQEVLAESILGPAKQYYRRGAYLAVIDRCDEIIKKYPDFTGMDRVLFLSGETKHKMNLSEESVTFYTQVVRDYPLSELVKDSTKRLKELKASVPEPNPIALNRARQQQVEGKGLLGWLSLGMVKNGGDAVPKETGAASVNSKGGELTIEPAKP